MTPFERVRPGQKFKPSAARENMLSDVARRQLMPIAPPSVRTSPPGGGGGSMLYGTAGSKWTSGNTISLTPCVSHTDSTATGTPAIVIDLVSPFGGTPPTNVNIAQGDIIAYQLYADQSATSKGLVVNVKIGGEGAGPTAIRQVLQCTSYTDATTYVTGYDYIRSHS